MAITAANLMSPQGPVEAFHFPNEDSNVISERLTNYIATASTDARVVAQQDAALRDNLTRLYALYLAFNQVYLRMLAEPASVQVTEKGGHAYSTEQMKQMQALSEKYYNDFTALLMIPGAQPVRRVTSMSLPTQVIF